jgi:hypothetical protein
VDAPTSQPGDFRWGPESEDGIRYLYIRIPGTPAYGFDALRCFRGADRGIEREWAWDGNEEKPTLTPSILNPDSWHGHLVAGRLESCP